MGQRFLIVDDSPTERTLLSAMLKELGHEVEVCESTKGVLEKLATGDYAAMFLDIVLPEGDGYKFLRQLRSNPKTANQYVVFSSTKRSKLEIDYGLKRAGADDYLPKPVTRDSLLEVLQRVKQKVK
ncbi:MAG: response regulator [Pseudanabaenaceae cyanobacterium]